MKATAIVTVTAAGVVGMDALHLVHGGTYYLAAAMGSICGTVIYPMSQGHRLLPWRRIAGYFGLALFSAMLLHHTDESPLDNWLVNWLWGLPDHTRIAIITFCIPQFHTVLDMVGRVKAALQIVNKK